jgi:hypothetical protein
MFRNGKIAREPRRICRTYVYENSAPHLEVNLSLQLELCQGNCAALSPRPPARQARCGRTKSSRRLLRVLLRLPSALGSANRECLPWSQKRFAVGALQHGEIAWRAALHGCCCALAVLPQGQNATASGRTPLAMARQCAPFAPDEHIESTQLMRAETHPWRQVRALPVRGGSAAEGPLVRTQVRRLMSAKCTEFSAKFT